MRKKYFSICIIATLCLLFSAAQTMADTQYDLCFRRYAGDSVYKLGRCASSYEKRAKNALYKAEHEIRMRITASSQPYRDNNLTLFKKEQDKWIDYSAHNCRILQSPALAPLGTVFLRPLCQAKSYEARTASLLSDGFPKPGRWDEINKIENTYRLCIRSTLPNNYQGTGACGREYLKQAENLMAGSLKNFSADVGDKNIVSKLNAEQRLWLSYYQASCRYKKNPKPQTDNSDLFSYYLCKGHVIDRRIAQVEELKSDWIEQHLPD